MTKSFFSLLFVVMFTAGSLTSSILPGLANATSLNLIQNSSFEASSNSLPNSWLTDSWGDNSSAFSYVDDAHTGSKAVQTSVDNWHDGDAKWMQTPISVVAGETYHYSDWYKSSVATNIWAQFTNVNGTHQYKFLKSASTSQSEWANFAIDVTIPESVQKVSIFHVIAENGQLILDDVSLIKNTECQSNNVGSIVNGDFESICDSADLTSALGWKQVQYGTASAVFNGQASDSFSGAKAASVINNDEGAEAGYQASITGVESNQRYNLKFWQKGDTYVYAYVTYGLSNGSVQYQSLMSVPTTLGEWSQYSDSFITPANTSSITITIATSGQGTITFDNASLNKMTNYASPLFNTGMVSVTFDDGSSSSYVNGFSAMKAYGYKGTFYLNAGAIGTSGYMTATQVKALAKDGQEIGSHLYHHSDMVQLDDLTLRSELSGNTSSLQSIIGTSAPIKSFASPYGSFTSSRVNTVMQYATSHRTTDGQLNTKANLDNRQIHARLLTSSTTVANVQAWINEAKASHAWLVLVYHNIALSSTGQDTDVAKYNVKPADFKKHLDAIKSSGLSVSAVTSALTTLAGQ